MTHVWSFRRRDSIGSSRRLLPAPLWLHALPAMLRAQGRMSAQALEWGFAARSWLARANRAFPSSLNQGIPTTFEPDLPALKAAQRATGYADQLSTDVEVFDPDNLWQSEWGSWNKPSSWPNHGTSRPADGTCQNASARRAEPMPQCSIGEDIVLPALTLKEKKRCVRSNTTATTCTLSSSLWPDNRRSTNCRCAG